MKTLSQFKAENNIDKLELLQGKGRKYCSVRDLSIVVSKSCDLAKPLFVVQLSKALDETDPESKRVDVPNAYVIVNSDVKQVESI